MVSRLLLDVGGNRTWQHVSCLGGKGDATSAWSPLRDDSGAGVDASARGAHRSMRMTCSSGICGSLVSKRMIYMRNRQTSSDQCDSNIR